MGGGHLPSLPDTRYSPANHCSIVLENFMTVLFNLTSDPKFRGGGGGGHKNLPSLPDASYGPGCELHV